MRTRRTFGMILYAEDHIFFRGGAFDRAVQEVDMSDLEYRSGKAAFIDRI